MNKTSMAQAVETLAQVANNLTDADLEREDWIWREYDGVRFAFLLTSQQLRELAVKVEAERATHGPALTSAQRILAHHHRIYQEMRGTLVHVKNDEVDRPPAEGEWPLRNVLAHMIRTETAFFVLIRYAIERLRTHDGRPVEMPEAEFEAAAIQEAGTVDTTGTLEQILAGYDALHQRILDSLADIHEDELSAPSVWWEGYEVEVRFRMHRFAAHIQEHAIQIDKTLDGIGHRPSEIERLLRQVYTALGEAEGTLIGSWESDNEGQHDVAEEIETHAREIAAL